MADLDNEFDSLPDLDADFDALPSQSQEPVYTADLNPEVSKMESFGKGVQQGTTLGFADEIGALSGALGAKVGGEKRDFGKVYDEIKDLLRQEYKQAEEQNPMSSLAGNIAGGLLPAGLTAPLAPAATGIGKAIQVGKAGAIAGGVAGLGTSEADVASGDTEQLKQAAKDVASGAVVGGVVGGGLQGLGTAASKTGGFIKNTIEDLPVFQDITDVFKESAKGTELLGKVGEKSKDIYNYGETILSKLTGARQKAGDAIDASAVAMDEVIPDGINMSNAYKEAVDTLDNITPANDMQAKVVAKVRELVNRTSSESGTVKPSELVNIRQQFNKLYKDARDSDTLDLVYQMKDYVTKPLVQAAEESESDAAKQFLAANKNYSLVDTAQRYFGAPTYINPADKSGKIKAIDKMFKTISSYEEEGGASKQKLNRAFEILDQISNDTPAGANIVSELPTSQLKTDMANKAKNLRLSEEISNESHLGRNIKSGFSTAKATTLQGARAAGNAAKVSKEAILDPIKRLVDSTPEQITALAEKAASTAKPFASALMKMASAPQQKRKALLFSLMQQPAFREFYNEDDK